MSWTKEQQKVIDLRDSDILVSAAAGSGKTAVLVERIIQKITDEQHPVDVDRLLVVTFTKAAAGEMKERISGALEKKVQEYPQNQHLIRQLSLIHKAQITTIHSFCMNLIRDYFYVLGIDPNTVAGDEGQLTLIKEEVMDEVLEEAYGSREEGFFELIEAYSPGKNDNVIAQYILKMYQNARSHVRPEKWLFDARENISVHTLEELQEAPFVKVIKEDVYSVVQSACRLIEKSMDLAKEQGGPYFYEKTLQQDMKFMMKLSTAKTLEEFCKEFQALKKPRLTGRKKKEDVIDDRKKEACKNLRERAYKLVEEMQSSYFYKDEGELLRELKIVRKPLEALIALTESFMEKYERRKNAENLMDFDDMEHFALRLLIDHFDEEGHPLPSAIAQEKAESYDEIYIDEYQDSNFIQDAILTSVSKHAAGGHNMFMVGDVKQSIYSFRLARPDLFIEKYHRYQSEDQQQQLVELRNNFRSRASVLNFVNDIFYQIMKESLGNIEYTKDVALVPTLPFPEQEGIDTVSELLLLEPEPVKESGEDAAVLEARMIARRIKEMVDGPKPMMLTGEDEDGNKILRKAQYGDIVILLRSMKGTAEIIQKELMDAGIPAFCNSQKGYFDVVELRVLLSLLSVVDNIYLDIDLAAVLRSPMIGMSAQELGTLKAEGKEESLYECLKQMADQMEKAKRALDLLEKLRNAKSYLSLNELIWMALEETGYYHFAGAMPQGEKRQRNILMLVEQAKSFESHQMKGLFHFIRFMEQCKEYDIDFGEANTLGEGEDIVHISSIHKSKGLEYPIVFVSRIHKRFNLRDSAGSIIFHPDYFIGADMINPVKRIKGTTILKSMIRRQIMKDSLSEELRVLYVAMTRAKEKLILTGVKKQEITWNNQREMSYMDVLSSTSYLDWILKALPLIHPKNFQLQIETLEDLAWLQEKESIDLQMEKEEFLQKIHRNVAEEQVRVLQDEFSYVYRNQAETAGQLKYSVSEIKRMSQKYEGEETIYPQISREEEKIPRFMGKEKTIAPTTRGTVVHKIFELLDYTTEYTANILDEKIQEWIKQGMIEAELDPLIPRGEILAFLESPMGQRVHNAALEKKVYKEKQFVIGVPFQEMDAESKGDAYVVVQGIIDLYFEEEDGLILVDYKTDRIGSGQEEALVQRYGAQLAYYKKALEQITGKKVKECCIYSVTLQKVITVMTKAVSES